MSNPLKLLFFDIETAPLLAHVWGQYADWIPHGQILHDSFMLSWAAKWASGKQVKSDVLDEHEAKAQQDHRLVRSLAELLRQADYSVAHNSDKFDVPVVSTRLIANGEEPIGPLKTIDTLKLARKTFRFASNRLDYLARALGISTKMKTDFELWRQCYLGDTQALKYMQKYNKHDVVVLEQVFEAIRPYAKGLPRLVEAAYEGEPVCPYCGSYHHQRRGKYRTNASTFQRYQCQDCKRWFRARSADKQAKGLYVPVPL